MKKETAKNTKGAILLLFSFIFLLLLPANSASALTCGDGIINGAEVCDKNGDVEIAVDVIEMTGKFDTLVLFSGDSDFNYLIKILRGKGKRAVVISTKYHISKELIESGNKYIDLKKLRGRIERQK